MRSAHSKLNNLSTHRTAHHFEKQTDNTPNIEEQQYTERFRKTEGSRELSTGCLSGTPQPNNRVGGRGHTASGP